MITERMAFRARRQSSRAGAESELLHSRGLAMKDESSQGIVEGGVCPIPLRHDEQVVVGHGSGGRMTHELVQRLFYPALGNTDLLRGDDAAVLAAPSGGRIAVCTDSHIVSPLFFPGGDIGRPAVCGTVNDLAMVVASPAGLTSGFLLYG